MRTPHRLMAVGVTTALMALGLLAAEPAAAAEIPADCTVVTIDNFEKSLTCNSRPASQQWHLRVACFSFGFEEVADGNVVTGNGTSNARCSVGFARNTIFIVDS